MSAQRALLVRIDEWLAANFELPRATELPRVEYATTAKIAALRYNGVAVTASADVTDSIARAAFERTTVAIYVDAEKTIYLPDEWSGQGPAELSVLVHEVVHHMQSLAESNMNVHASAKSSPTPRKTNSCSCSDATSKVSSRSTRLLCWSAAHALIELVEVAPGLTHNDRGPESRA